MSGILTNSMVGISADSLQNKAHGCWGGNGYSLLLPVLAAYLESAHQSLCPFLKEIEAVHKESCSLLHVCFGYDSVWDWLREAGHCWTVTHKHTITWLGPFLTAWDGAEEGRTDVMWPCAPGNWVQSHPAFCFLSFFSFPLGFMEKRYGDWINMYPEKSYCVF